MYIPNQLIGAPVNTQVTIECTTEASPKVEYNMAAVPHCPTQFIHMVIPLPRITPGHHLLGVQGGDDLEVAAAPHGGGGGGVPAPLQANYQVSDRG